MKENIVIVFSKNRALQLDLCLNSLFSKCSDVSKLFDITVLYNTTEEYSESYRIVENENRLAKFVEEKSFKEDFLREIKGYTHILFLCDDVVFTEEFSLKQVLRYLNSDENYLGFSLRLGKNCTYCFPYDAQQTIPEFKSFRKNSGVSVYQWKSAHLDFGYPLEVSSSVYRIEDLIKLLEDCEYQNPNTLEAVLVENTGLFVIDKPLVLCFDKSIAFSIPLNRVQTYNQNRCGIVNESDLLRSFVAGKRVNPEIFAGYINKGAHELVEKPFEEMIGEKATLENDE